jgi:Leucine-rich repeat (LRR) protein
MILRPLQGSRFIKTLVIYMTPVKSIAPIGRPERSGAPPASALEILNVGGTGVADLDFVANFKLLRELYVWDTDTHDISFLSGLSELRELYLRRCPVTDLSPLTDLHRLEMLSLTGTMVSNLSPIEGNQALSYLDAEETQIHDWDALATLPSLRHIRVNRSAAIGVLSVLNSGKAGAVFELSDQLSTPHVAELTCRTISPPKRKPRRYTNPR